MKKSFLVFLVVCLLSLPFAGLAAAQSEGLTLQLSRDWGYGGFGNDIQGTFTMKATGPADLARVEFFIDETKIGEAKTAPFALQFVTDEYAPGTHSLYAVGYTAGGSQLRSQIITSLFLSADQANGSMTKIMVPILAIVFGSILITALVSIFLGRGQKKLEPGSPRSYPLGGGICPKCNHAIPFPFLGMNLIGRKFFPCPSCGKWVLVGYASMEELREAERAEIESAKGTIAEMSEEEKFTKSLDDSRYSN